MEVTMAANRGTRDSMRVAIIRGGEWDTTQAVPRVVNTLREHFDCDIDVYGWASRPSTPIRQEINGVTIRNFGLVMPRAGFRYFAMWPLFWIWLAKELRNHGYTHLHVMNIDCVIPAVFSKMIHRQIVVYDIRDAWGMTLALVSRRAAYVFQQLDRLFSSRVDGLLLSTGGLNYTARYFGPKTAQSVPVIQVLNVPEKDYYSPDRFIEYADGEILRVNYSGHISAVRAANELLEAAERVPSVILHVYGKIKDEKLRTRLEASPSVLMDDLVPHEIAMDYLRQDHVAALIYNPKSVASRILTANKLFEAMMLSRPVICSRGTLLAKIAEDSGCGWSVSYGDLGELIELFEWMVDNPELVNESGKRGRKAYEEKYQWKDQQSNIVELYRLLGGDSTVITRSIQGWSRFVGRASTPPLSVDEMSDMFI